MMVIKSLLKILLPLACAFTVLDSAAAKLEACKSVEQIERSIPMVGNLPVKVKIALYIVDIKKINDVEQEYSTDFFTSFSWHDPNLAFKADDPDDFCVYPLNDIWHPRLELFNIRDINKKFDELVHVKPSGEVEYLQRYIGDMSSPFNLIKFPRDKQTLSIRIISINYGPDQVKLESDPTRTGRQTPFSISSWMIGKGQPHITVFAVTSSHVQTVYNPRVLFTYDINAVRNVNYYTWKIILPLSIILFMSWAVFWIKPHKIEVRLGLAATAMLTLIAFRFSIDRLLPQISYLTLIDYFIFFGLLLVFIAFIESVIVCGLGLNEKVERAMRIDQYSRIIFPLLYIAMTLYFWFW